jgi:hypothetical protein
MSIEPISELAKQWMLMVLLNPEIDSEQEYVEVTIMSYVEHHQ